MNRSFVYGLVGLIGVAAVGTIPLACRAGGVGVPCIPEDEFSFRFAGFKVSEDIIESRSFQCETRICLVNHFQGRVSCPLGQGTPVDRNGQPGCTPEVQNGAPVDGQGSCSDGQKCVNAGSFSPACDPTKENADDFCIQQKAGVKCNEAGFCECGTNADCPEVTGAIISCDSQTHQCVSFACLDFDADNQPVCQQLGAKKTENAGKACCVPGTDKPVTVPVCGQCLGDDDVGRTRDAENAVYCSCRCGVAEDEPPDPNFNFCTCPADFECVEIRKNLGIGDEKITGKFCIKKDTTFEGDQQCGRVDGYQDSGQCPGGLGTGRCLTADDPNCKDDEG